MASGHDNETLIKLLHRCEGCKKHFDTVVNRPKQRICGHSFCDSCLNKTKECQNCKKVSPENWSFPENSLMIKLDEKCLTEKKKKYTSFIKLPEELRSNINHLTQTYNKHISCFNHKIQKYEKAKVVLIQHFSNLNFISQIKSHPLEERLKEVVTMMSDLLKDDFQEDYLTTPLTNFKPIEIKGDIKPFKFTEGVLENLSTLREAKNVFIGYSINGNLMWGRIRTVKNAFIFGSLRQMEEDDQPKLDATIVHFNCIKESIRKHGKFFFELEVNDKFYKSLRKKSEKFPKTFKIYIGLKSDFTENPLAMQFYYLCTGETGASYIQSEVTVSKDKMKVYDRRKGDLIPNIPEKKSQEWVAAVDSVCASRLSGEYSCFYIVRTSKNLSGDFVHIGDMISGQNFIRDNMKCSVIDCGFVLS